MTSIKAIARMSIPPKNRPNPSPGDGIREGNIAAGEIKQNRSDKECGQACEGKPQGPLVNLWAVRSPPEADFFSFVDEHARKAMHESFFAGSRAGLFYCRFLGGLYRCGLRGTTGTSLTEKGWGLRCRKEQEKQSGKEVSHVDQCLLKGTHFRDGFPVQESSRIF